MWHIYFIMWVSWSWKSTLISNIKKLKLNNVSIPLSYKTRPIREWEINWVDAYFISKEEFFLQVQNWEFLEYALVHEIDYYWTKYKDIFENWIESWKIVIKEIDINWLENLKKNKQELNWKYTTIFLNIPKDILEKRIEKRWIFMNNNELQKRINSSIIEEKKAKKLCDYIIDATVSEEEILNNFLKIFKIKSWKYI